MSNEAYANHNRPKISILLHDMEQLAMELPETLPESYKRHFLDFRQSSKRLDNNSSGNFYFKHTVRIWPPKKFEKDELKSLICKDDHKSQNNTKKIYMLITELLQNI